VGPGV